MKKAYGDFCVSVGTIVPWLVSCIISEPESLNDFLRRMGWRKVSKWAWEKMPGG